MIKLVIEWIDCSANSNRINGKVMASHIGLMALHGSVARVACCIGLILLSFMLSHGIRGKVLGYGSGRMGRSEKNKWLYGNELWKKIKIVENCIDG